jgi:hypothetical protein
MRHETAAVSRSRRVDELPRRIKRAEIVEVVVPAACQPHELLRLVRQREQALAKADGNAGSSEPCMMRSGTVTRAMRWSEWN